MKLIEYIRKKIVGYCVSNINKDIYQYIFAKLSTKKEKLNIIASLNIIRTQRRFNATLEN